MEHVKTAKNTLEHLKMARSAEQTYARQLRFYSKMEHVKHAINTPEHPEMENLATKKLVTIGNSCCKMALAIHAPTTKELAKMERCACQVSAHRNSRCLLMEHVKTVRTMHGVAQKMRGKHVDLIVVQGCRS